MDYSLLVGIHDIDQAEAGDDVDDFLGAIESNEDSDIESPREVDSDSPGEGETSFSETPPTTPPADVNGARERNTSYGSADLEDGEEDDLTEKFQSVGGMFISFSFLDFCYILIFTLELSTVLYFVLT